MTREQSEIRDRLIQATEETQQEIATLRERRQEREAVTSITPQVVREKFAVIEKEMNAFFLERQEFIRAMLVGLLAKRHLLVLGPPGTAKSQAAQNLCERIGGKYFYRLLNPQSVIEEIVGPLDAAGLMETPSRYRRNTQGTLVEATVALIDEVYKSNSSTLNIMLPIMNERIFVNDGEIVQIPLQFLIGASNELPQEREELVALHDRFLLRLAVGYLRDDANFERLLMSERKPAVGTKMTDAELKAAQDAVLQMDTTKIVPHFRSLRRLLGEKGIHPSDRRWKESLDLLRANAFLDGATEVSDEDLAILAHSLWQEPDQIVPVRQVILQLVNPFSIAAQDLLDEANELYQAALNAPLTEQVGKVSEANSKLANIARKLDGLRKDAKEKNKPDDRIVEALGRVRKLRDEIVSAALKREE